MLSEATTLTADACSLLQLQLACWDFTPFMGSSRN